MLEEKRMFKLIGKAFMISVLIVNNLFASTVDNMKYQLERVAGDTRKIYKLPALAISVRLPSQQWVEVYQGNVSMNSSQPIDENTLFQVGSTTKTFTAVLVLKLAAMNKLHLHDPISKWLPQYPKWSNVTVLQLLNHTSGIYDYIDVPFWWYRLDFHRSKLWTAAELVDLAYSRPFYFPIGLGWHYSNTDYVLLGMIIEKVTHMPFEEALNQYVLNDMHDGMRHTYYIVGSMPPTVSQYLAHGYRNESRDMTSLNTSWLQAGGALISNAHDLADGYWNIFSRQIVTNDMVKKLTAFVSVNDGRVINDARKTGYGLGIFSVATPYGQLWFAPGLTPGYTTNVAWLPCRQIAFAYITNNTPSKKGFHAYLLGQILRIITMQGSKQCTEEHKTNGIDFPSF